MSWEGLTPPYGTIVADPPWGGYRTPGATKANAAKHYSTMHAIFATRGNPVVPADKPLSTWFEWPAAQHSAKPDAFADLVEQVSPGPYVELFCRRPRLGWDSWGHGYELGGVA